MMNLRLAVILSVGLSFGLAACGGGSSSYRVPVDSELKPFVAPEAEDLVADDGVEDDENDSEDAAESSDKPATAAPAPAAPAPAAAPAARPAKPAGKN
jgi:hypothetical protein